MKRVDGRVAVIVVAAGRGERFGTPKQFLTLGGERLVDRAVNAASAVGDEVILVLPAAASWDDPDSVGAASDSALSVSAVVAGGPSRSASVRAGLAVVPLDCKIVVVHDAARPLASTSLFQAVTTAVREGADAAVPGIPVADTLKRVEHDRVIETVPRDSMITVQTPQAFRADVLRAAHIDEPDATDDAALVEAAGGRVVVVPGETRNLKITEADDLAVAAALLEAPAEPPAEVPAEGDE